MLRVTGKDSLGRTVHEYFGSRARELAFNNWYDGIFYDAVWENFAAAWGNIAGADFDNNGVADPDPMDPYLEGQEEVLRVTRDSIGPNKILMHNGHSIVYNGTYPGYSTRPFINGELFERWPWDFNHDVNQDGLLYGISRYTDFMGASSFGQKIYINNGGSAEWATWYKMLRLLFTANLMHDGYHSYDNMSDHSIFYWYDEYDNAGKGLHYLGGRP